MRMVRKALNLLVDEDLVRKARDHGLIISKFLENQLRGYFKYIEDRENNYTPYNSSINSDDKISYDSSKNDKSNNTFSIYDTALGARGVAWHPSTLGW